MIELPDSMHKKVNFLVAGAIIVVVTVLAALAISVKAKGSLINFGAVAITYYQPQCVLDPISGTCPNCPVCTAHYGSACAGMEEIDFKPARGSDTNFLCPPRGYRYLGGTPRVGGQLLGNGTNEAAPLQIGVSR